MRFENEEQHLLSILEKIKINTLLDTIEVPYQGPTEIIFDIAVQGPFSITIDDPVIVVETQSV